MSFATPGFNLPTEATADAAVQSKKRKRPQSEPVSLQDANLEPQINIEKLFAKFHALDKSKDKPAAAVATSDKAKPAKKPRPERKITSEGSLKKIQAARAAATPVSTASHEPSDAVNTQKKTEPPQKLNKKQKMKLKKQLLAQQQSNGSEKKEDNDVHMEESAESLPVASTSQNAGEGMTELQKQMKAKLGGARFRQINEQLVSSMSCCRL